MPSRWEIDFWPECPYHVFLSHCQEDREQLVVPVFNELKRRRLIPRIDRHHYPLARDALQALRDALLRCRHVVYFLTPAALANGRGWMAVERSFCDAIQRRMVYGDEISHLELPLLFVPLADPSFQRSIWRILADKCRIVDVSPAEPSGWGAAHIQWSADMIERFVIQEERWALEISDRMREDTLLQQHFIDPNLRGRIICSSPPSIIVRP